MNEKQKRLYRYLKKEVDNEKEFFKSKYIKEDLDLSAKEIGLNIIELDKKVDDLNIEKWSNAKGNTWKVEIKDRKEKPKVTA